MGLTERKEARAKAVELNSKVYIPDEEEFQKLCKIRMDVGYRWIRVLRELYLSGEAHGPIRENPVVIAQMSTYVRTWAEDKHGTKLEWKRYNAAAKGNPARGDLVKLSLDDCSDGIDQWEGEGEDWKRKQNMVLLDWLHEFMDHKIDKDWDEVWLQKDYN